MAVFDFENQSHQSLILGAGQISMGGGVAATVTFPGAAPSSSYAVQLTPLSEPVHNWWVTDKTVDGFVVNSNLPCSCALDWVAISA